MKINPHSLMYLANQSRRKLIAISRSVLNPIDSVSLQDDSNVNNFDDAILQQGRFWMRTVTWTLIGSSLFSVTWLALAQTEEIVVAPGELEPIGSVQDIQMPVGGVADEILVEEGDRVKAGQVLMKLDTEASEELHKSLEKTIKLKQEQLILKQEEKRNAMQVNQEEALMLKNNLKLQSEILKRHVMLKEIGAFSEIQYLTRET